MGIALLVVGGAMALVFDRLWQDAAAIELQTACESASLAAAHRLADEDRLKRVPDWDALCEDARQAAARMASGNLVGGNPVHLSADDPHAIELGQTLLDRSGEPVLVQTILEANTAQVTVTQGRGSSNPVGLLVRDLTGAGRQMQVTMTAHANNHVTALRPLPGVNVPILPIAVAAGQGATGPTPGWDLAIEAKAGLDTCGVARGTRTIVPGPDGLPELTVVSAPSQAEPRDQLLATLHVFDIGQGLSGERLAEQCRDGWTADDLEQRGGEFVVDGRPNLLRSTPKIPQEVTEALQDLVGETRMCLVYDAVLPGTPPDQWTLSCMRLVSVRILAVQPMPDGIVTLQLQPAVIVSKTVLVGDQSGLPNPYVYKVSITK